MDEEEHSLSFKLQYGMPLKWNVDTVKGGLLHKWNLDLFCDFKRKAVLHMRKTHFPDTDLITILIKYLKTIIKQ